MEPQDQPRRELTSGPISPGTRFCAEWVKVVEYVRFERQMAAVMLTAGSLRARPAHGA
jgi:hypothetical protein